ncbi:MAG: hypothetical protein K2Z81_10205, partial [Cyanobacteria bacterium]|nr:hypothetical protein [Cyanobacteriota bacterium]
MLNEACFGSECPSDDRGTSQMTESSKLFAIEVWSPPARNSGQHQASRLDADGLPARKEETEGGKEIESDSSSWDLANLQLPEVARFVLDQIQLNPSKLEDQLSFAFLRARDELGRKTALDQLSQLGATGRQRSAQMNIINNAIKIAEIGRRFESPHLMPQEKILAEKELVDLLKSLVRKLPEVSRHAGAMTDELPAARVSSVDEAMARLLNQARRMGRGAEVQRAFEECIRERLQEQLVVRDALSRFASVQAPPEDRKSALRELGKVSSTNSGVLEDLLAQMTAADSVLCLKEATSPSDLAHEVARLKTMALSGNKYAAQIDKQLNTAGDFWRELFDGDKAVAEKSVKALQQLVERKDGKAFELVTLVRIREAMSSISSRGEPTKETLEAIRVKLERLGESPLVNDWLAWTKNEENLQNLASPENSRRGLENLTQSYQQEDRYARTALSQLLLSGSPETTVTWQKLDSTSSDHGGKPGGFVNLSRLSVEQRNELKLAALAEIKKNVKENTLTRSESAALGLALRENPENQPFRQAVQEILEGALNRGVSADERKTNHRRAIEAGKATEEVLSGLFDALSHTDLTTSGGRLLLLEYVRGANCSDNVFLAGDRSRIGDIGRGFNQQIERSIEKAKTGDRSAMLLLAFISAGIGKVNSLNNPSVLNAESTAMVPGNERARRAAIALLEIAQSRPSEVITALSDKALAHFPDDGLRLETLGKVMSQAGMLTGSSKESLFEGLASPSRETRASSARGIVECIHKLKAEDLAAIAERPSAELAAALSNRVDRIPGPVGRALAQRITEGIARDVRSNGGEECLFQRADMLGALGRFVGAQEIGTLTRLSGERGLKTMSLHLGQENARAVQKFLGKTLLTIGTASLDEGGRARAIAALAGNDWGLDRQLDREIASFGKRYADNPSVSEAVTRLISTGDRPTLAAQFRRMGVPIGDASVATMTENAITRYGAEKVQTIIDRIALFNALPPEERARVSASSEKVSEGENFNLKGKTLDARTFASLPEYVRKKINGDVLLKVGEKVNVTEQIVLTALEFNWLPAQSRRALNGEARFLKPAQTVSLSGSLDAHTFNALPA